MSTHTAQPLIWLARRCTSSSVECGTPALVADLLKASSASIAPGTEMAGLGIRDCMAFSCSPPACHTGGVDGVNWLTPARRRDVTGMDEEGRLAELFEEHRPRLRAVAYRMLGSVAEADDAVQDAWLRLARVDVGEIDNLGGWLTTVVARICLNVLRSRRNHPHEPLEVHVPDPVVDRPDAMEPEHEALLADAIGLALMTVLQTLPPAERLALVLHDSFAVPFEEIATILDRTPAATRQLASRGRRKVQGAPTTPEPDQARQRQIVDAWFAASRQGDFAALVALLDPDAVQRTDTGQADTSSILARRTGCGEQRPRVQVRRALDSSGAGQRHRRRGRRAERRAGRGSRVHHRQRPHRGHRGARRPRARAKSGPVGAGLTSADRNAAQTVMPNSSWALVATIRHASASVHAANTWATALRVYPSVLSLCG